MEGDDDIVGLLQKECGTKVSETNYDDVRKVVEVVANFYGLSVYELKKGRTVRCSKARKVVAYIFRNEKCESLDRIAYFLERRDRCSVLHMIIAFEKELQSDQKLQEELSTVLLLCHV